MDTNQQPAELNPEVGQAQAKNKKIPAIIAGSIVIFLGLTAGLYTFGSSLFISEERIMNQVLDNVAALSSVAYETKISVAVTSDPASQDLFGDMKVDYVGSGVTNTLDNTLSLDKISSEGKHALSVQIPGEPEDFTTGLKADIKLKDAVLYAKFEQLPNLFFIDFSQAPLKDFWIRADLANSGTDGESIADLFSTELQKGTTITRREVIDLYKTSPFLVPKNVATKRNDLGVSVYEIDFALDSERFIAFAKSLETAFYPENTQITSPEEYEDLRNMLNGIADFVIRAEIGRKDNMVYMFTTSGTVYDPSGNRNNSMAFAVTSSFKEHNKPALVQVPTESRDIEDVLTELEGSFGGVSFSE